MVTFGGFTVESSGGLKMTRLLSLELDIRMALEPVAEDEGRMVFRLLALASSCGSDWDLIGHVLLRGIPYALMCL